MAACGTGQVPWPFCPTPQFLMQFPELTLPSLKNVATEPPPVPVAPASFDALKAELAALPDDAPYAKWGRWFLADRATRPIGPGLKLTVAEVEGRAKE